VESPANIECGGKRSGLGLCSLEKLHFYWAEAVMVRILVCMNENQFQVTHGSHEGDQFGLELIQERHVGDCFVEGVDGGQRIHVFVNLAYKLWVINPFGLEPFPDSQKLLSRI
jgi:hypothetical protein